MVNELVAGIGYHSYNINFAKIVGLESAVYFSALCNLSAVQESNKITIDRKRIKTITTLTEAKQKKCDLKLSELSVLTVIEDNVIEIDFDMYLTLFSAKPQVEEKVKKLKSVHATKKDFMLSSLKNRLTVSMLASGKENPVYIEDSALVPYFDEWLDAVYGRFGYISNAVVVDAKEVLRKYARSSDEAKVILHIATTKSWRDLKWAGEEFLKQDWQESTTLKSTLGQDANLTGEVIF